MFKFELPVDEKQVNAIKARQARDEERKARIFAVGCQP